MAGTRAVLDLFFKDKTPQQVNAEFPNLLPAIKAAKAKASNVNAKEMTIIAKYHICYHDENPTKPCGPEVEI